MSFEISNIVSNTNDVVPGGAQQALRHGQRARGEVVRRARRPQPAHAHARAAQARQQPRRARRARAARDARPELRERHQLSWKWVYYC